MSLLHCFVLAVPDGGPWGVVRATADGPALGFLASGGADAQPGPGRLAPATADAPGRVAVAGAELTLEPVGGAVSFDSPGPATVTLCHARGALAGGEAIDALGILAAHELSDDAIAVRLAAVVLDAGEGVWLTAVRPRKAKGHDRDVVLAALFEGGQAHAVADPRVSVTARPDGRLVRAGLELWLIAADEPGAAPASDPPASAAEEPEAADAEAPAGAEAATDQTLLFPRRAAGSPLGIRATGTGPLGAATARVADDRVRWTVGREVAEGVLGTVELGR